MAQQQEQEEMNKKEEERQRAEEEQEQRQKEEEEKRRQKEEEEKRQREEDEQQQQQQVRRQQQEEEEQRQQHKQREDEENKRREKREYLEKNLTDVEKEGLATIKKNDKDAKLVAHYNWLRKSPPSCKEKQTVEDHEHRLLPVCQKHYMVHVPGNGHCAYASVIAGLKHAHHTDPNCFQGKNSLRDKVVKQEDVNKSIFNLRDCIIKKGTTHLHQRKGFSEENAKAVFIYSLSPEAEGSNYGGLAALDCLAHELDFCANIYDEIGCSAHSLRPDELKLPLINLVRLNLVAGSMAEHKPLCSHPTVMKLKESRPASSLTLHSPSSAKKVSTRISGRNKLTQRQRKASSTGEATGQPEPIKINKIKKLGTKLTKSRVIDSNKRQVGGEATDGLLVQCTPNKKKTTWLKGHPLTVWCCKFAFSSDKECTLAFCTACKVQWEERCLSEDTTEEGSSRKRTSKRQRKVVQQTKIGFDITAVTCCPKGECGKHTEGDLIDLVDQNISEDCLRASRRKKDDSGWDNVAAHCWGCGIQF